MTTRKRSSASQRPAPRKLTPDAQARRWHTSLVEDPAALKYLTDVRALTSETIERFKIGLARTPNNIPGDWYTIPIRDNGRLVQVRLRARDPDAKGNKYRPLYSQKGPRPDWVVPGGLLYDPTETLRDEEEESVVLGEGELDAILANQNGFPAVSTTLGAGAWKDEWTERFRNKIVYVTSDPDDAGRKANLKRGRALFGVARSVRIVPLPGGDINDYFAKEGHSAEDFKALLGSARQFDPWDFASYPGVTDDVQSEGYRQYVRTQARRELGRILSPEPILDLAQVLGEAEDESASFVVQPFIPDGDYGFLAAEDKAGKTWAAIDMAVSVASGVPWLGSFPIGQPGGVLFFFGEGSKRKFARRLRAVCEHKRIDLDELTANGLLRVRFRVPDLTNEDSVAMVADELAAHAAVLVIIDPLYLAAGDADGRSLFSMGAVFAPIQAVVQRAGSALLILHHWTQGGRGGGAQRMAGAGPRQWGRFRLSLAMATETDAETRRTTASGTLRCDGDEMGETTVGVTRVVWADDPDDLQSPMHYSVRIDEAIGGVINMAREAVRSVVREEWASTGKILRLVREQTEQTKMSKSTLLRHLDGLLAAGNAEKRVEGEDGSFEWRRTPVSRRSKDRVQKQGA